MAVQEYKVTYKNGDTQKVEADAYGVYNGFMVFSASEKDVLSIAASEVKSVARADIEDVKKTVATAPQFHVA